MSEDDLIAGQAAELRLLDADNVQVPAIPLPKGEGLDAHLHRSLLDREREIGLRYAAQHVRTWPYTALALGCFAIWLAMFPLAFAGLLPLWLGCAVSSVFVAGGYVIAHEAMHSNIGREGTPQRFWNELAGQVSTIPLILPFSMVKTMHLLHHKHCNDPVKDPDAIHCASNWFTAAIKSWLNRQPGSGGTAARWRRHLAEIGTPRARRVLHQTMALQLVVMTLWFTAAWNGYAIEVALLWWLPRHIGLTYIHAVLSWPTHHPHSGMGRYDNTRVTRNPLGYVGSMAIDFHIVHHLYPHIPVHATRAAFRELRPILEARGVDCSAQPG